MLICGACGPGFNSRKAVIAETNLEEWEAQYGMLTWQQQHTGETGQQRRGEERTEEKRKGTEMKVQGFGKVSPAKFGWVAAQVGWMLCHCSNVLAVNLRAPYIFCREALRDMNVKKSGYIINVIR